jgi:hypothetical protein
MGPEYDFNIEICHCIVGYVKHRDESCPSRMPLVLWTFELVCTPVCSLKIELNGQYIDGWSLQTETVVFMSNVFIPVQFGMLYLCRCATFAKTPM